MKNILLFFILSLSFLLISCADAFKEINGLEEIFGDDEAKKDDPVEIADGARELLSGVFVDAAVQGASFTSSAGGGLTDGNGTFYYFRGDTVVFTIGGITLGTATGQSQVTPVNLVADQFVTNRKVVNILRFLQTLDDDGNPSNGITINSAVRSAAANSSVNFDQSTTAFETSTATIISTLTSKTSIGTTGLTSASSAVTHFTDVVDTINSSSESAVTISKRNPTDISLSSTAISSNTAGATVGTLSATDADTGDAHTFSLVSGTGDTNNSSFSIDGTTLKIGTALDFSTSTSKTIRVRATDLTGLTYEESFTFSVNGPTALSLSATSIAENSSSGSTVGTFSTTDADSDDSHTYSLVTGTGSTNNGSFSISGSTLLTAASFDYETTSSYSIRVRSTDSVGAYYEAQLTITVTDVAEAPTVSSGTITLTCVAVARMLSRSQAENQIASVGSISGSWNTATDETTATASLVYQVYTSSSNNIDTVANMEANGTVLTSYTANLTSFSGGTTSYYFNVIVKDEAGNKSAYTSAQGSCT
ncbi:MAG: cadherin repeat domain-containing protein [SAR324 cluster bacterium]|nr:cadherin repeat domain-containing protein [SAR324 cluster bacterium]